MTGQKCANRFCRDVDRLLRSPGAKAKPVGPMPEEYRQAIELAEMLAVIDFSTECGVYQDLRKRLLERFAVCGARRTGNLAGVYMELGDEELENVAGGGEKERKDACTLCLCRRSARTIMGDTCPDCGHPRECHPIY